MPYFPQEGKGELGVSRECQAGGRCSTLTAQRACRRRGRDGARLREFFWRGTSLRLAGFPETRARTRPRARRGKARLGGFPLPHALSGDGGVRGNRHGPCGVGVTGGDERGAHVYTATPYPREPRAPLLGSSPPACGISMLRRTMSCAYDC